MNNVIMRTIQVGTDFAPLVAESLMGSVEISTPPTNSGPVIFQGDDGNDVAWVPGEFHSFRRIDLSKLQAKGSSGDVITIVGGTW